MSGPAVQAGRSGSQVPLRASGPPLDRAVGDSSPRGRPAGTRIREGRDPRLREQGSAARRQRPARGAGPDARSGGGPQHPGAERRGMKAGRGGIRRARRPYPAARRILAGGAARARARGGLAGQLGAAWPEGTPSRAPGSGRADRDGPAGRAGEGSGCSEEQKTGGGCRLRGDAGGERQRAGVRQVPPAAPLRLPSPRPALPPAAAQADPLPPDPPETMFPLRPAGKERRQPQMMAVASHTGAAGSETEEMTEEGLFFHARETRRSDLRRIVQLPGRVSAGAVKAESQGCDRGN